MGKQWVPLSFVGRSEELADVCLEEIQVDQCVDECAASVFDGVKFWSSLEILQCLSWDRAEDIGQMHQGSRVSRDAVEIVEGAEMPTLPFSSPHTNPG